ncbi:MAG: hypothetical protein ACXABF_17500 [Candidatus Thorarchaeota archaeon]|jgi:hypothetical protein
MKVVINRCFGGFGLSTKAEERLTELGLSKETHYELSFREHPLLVQIVEELGDEANAEYAELGIVEIPDGIEYTIKDYDGVETIHEVHRSWP